MPTKMYLLIKEVQGEVQEEDYKGAIDVLSFSHGIHRETHDNKTELCYHYELNLVKYCDISTPKFYDACEKATIFPEAIFSVIKVKGDKGKLMDFKLFNAKVTACRPGGSAQSMEDNFMEEISFTYEKIEWIYYIPKELRRNEETCIKARADKVNFPVKKVRYY